MNDWRYFRYRPRSAHLWDERHGGLWKSKCGRVVLDIFTTTHPLTNSELIPKCRICIQHEIRNKEMIT